MLKPTVCACILYVVLVAAGNRESRASCMYHSPAELDSTKCTQAVRDFDRGDFQDIWVLLQDAKTIHSSPDFVAFVLGTMYRYVHCATEMDTVVALYFGLALNNLPTGVSVSPEWWKLAYEYISSRTMPLLGRGRNVNQEDIDLLENKTKSMVRSPGPFCVQWLINHYTSYASAWWISNHRSFPNPNQYIVYQTTTTSTTTTTTPPTTSTTPTTTTTATTTTVTTTTTTPVPSITTTSTTAFVQQNPARCSQCAALDCLLFPAATECSRADQAYCLTTVTDSQLNRRNITRGCADKAQCDSIVRHASCADVDSQFLGAGVVCEFCCSGDNCNLPPSLFPKPGTLYSPNQP